MMVFSFKDYSLKEFSRYYADSLRGIKGPLNGHAYIIKTL